VGGADALPVNRSAEDDTRRWKSDPVWRATNIAPDAELADAQTAAEWPVGRLTSWSQRQGRGPRVRDLIPDDFEAYVRILFPIFESAHDRHYVAKLFTWHDTALRNRRQPHRLMDLVGVGPDPDDARSRPRHDNCAYLGTSDDCAEDIFASTVIEAVVAQPDDPAWVGMDTVNRPASR
jgi:hypothetical protein